MDLVLGNNNLDSIRESTGEMRRPSYLNLGASVEANPFAWIASFANTGLVDHDETARVDKLQHRAPLLFAENHTS